ncbi:MAG: molecular chaperone HtpG [Clostridia bacterium]|nr:molecular chaperone HtpG [Clostridia bacterium]
MSDSVKKGGISVETEHMFPVIKKWLYSEKDIFLREIVSNAVDAVTKLKRLSSLGEASVEDEQTNPFRVTVSVDKESRTLTVKDNGIGMTEEEVERYICQIAISGALEFIQKYESETDKENSSDGNSKNGIIGHFGLGFYSAFMVSDTVEIVTKSYTGAPAVHWTCDDEGNYEMTPSDKEDRGTSVIMHISEEESDFLEESRLRDILEKYCLFMPVEIYFVNENKAPASDEKTAEDGKKEEKEAEKPINDTHPLWLKNASECTDQEYIDFYHKVFRDYREPLFWIHLNADYPLNFKGILYFPKLNHEYESIEGQVKLYYNQVFVADNIKEVIPEYLLMLKGVLDCPELPLNVSRSYLQNDAYVSRISAHIVKKTADKLNSLCKTDREKYNKVWPDIKTFVEYACIRDRKFYDRVKDSLLFLKTDGTCVTLNEYTEAAKDKNEKTVYYTTDKALQAQYISLFAAQGIEVVEFNQPIDTQFVSSIENYGGQDAVKFSRVDADTSLLKNETAQETDEETKNRLTELFRKASGNEKLNVAFEALKDETVPAVLIIKEESRRFEDMMRMYSMGMDTGSFPAEQTLHINTSASLIRKIISLSDSKEEEDKVNRLASYIYKLSVLAQRKLTSEELSSFLNDTYGLLDQL